MKQEPRIEIRTATSSDAGNIARILASAFAEYEQLYTKEGYAATTLTSGELLARLREGHTWVALLDGTNAGTVSVVPRGADLHIRSMAVVPEARGNRIGEKLLRYIEDFGVRSKCRRLTLSTTPFLHRAIRLYEHSGFVRKGIADLHGTPLITMEKSL